MRRTLSLHGLAASCVAAGWFVAMAAVALGAQTAAPAPASEPDPAPAVYTYDPAGRPDPFQSLINRGTDFRVPETRPEGLAGLLLDEIALKGIIRSEGQFVAMVQAPDNRTYVIRPSDGMLDATVKAITADAVIFVQQVNDPLSLVREREVERLLRADQEGL